MKDTIRWTATKIARRLDLVRPLVYQARCLLSPFKYHKLEHYTVQPPVYAQGKAEEWIDIPYDTYWGEWYSNFASRGEFTIPLDWDPSIPAALYLPLGEAGDFCHPEALIYIDGVHYASCDRFHQEIILPGVFRDGKIHRLELVGWTGIGDIAKDLPTKLFMRSCYIVQINEPLRGFISLARVSLGIVNNLDENDQTRWHLLNALDDAFKCLDLAEPLGGRAFYQSIPTAHKTLQTGVEKSGRPLDITIYSAGHAHIDVAWLWPLEQSRRKAQHTFQNVIRLMEQFPEFHFTQSQPQLYNFVRQDAPQLFKSIQEKVGDGSWELIGGMWVEADCNLTGPESLARQFLLGRSFFRRHFGEESDSRVLWLPDVFGYAWNLPQLIKQAGLDYFFTIKIGWNQYNRLPFDSFWWQGLDGTRVLTHFSTTPEAGSIDSGFGASTYNAAVAPEQAIGSWTNFLQKDLARPGENLPLLMAFGYGDGGGGPTREMLENLQVMNEFPSIPRVIPGKVSDFFETLEKDFGSRLPTWNGELYFELHRGTYTSQSRNKRANRKVEFLLHDTEFLATLAVVSNPGYIYPADRLNTAWELICLNQFHDIIPGSSVNQVYIESQQQYLQIQGIAEEIKVNAISAIHEVLAAGLPTCSISLMAINPNGFIRNDLVFLPQKIEAMYVIQSQGVRLQTQVDEDGTLIYVPEFLPYSVLPLTLVRNDNLADQARDFHSGLFVSRNCLENDYLKVEINDDGDITRIYDKVVQREILPDHALGNQFQAFEDRPLNWDAWDIDIFYDDKMWLSEPADSIEIVASGLLKAAIKIKRRILHSEFIQTISLAFNSPRLDFDTRIDWHERHVLLKVAFPVMVLSPIATYEIQWGNVERPTHRNTSWDWARFETCAQKWVDLSEGGYGVSLLNDCKYGHDIHENVMRISLLRSPTSPDPEADQGAHQFKYSLFPHRNRWNEATVKEAYALNDPLIVVDAQKTLSPILGSKVTTKQHLFDSFVRVDAPNMVIETIKQAEDGNGIIVRMYDCLRMRGPVLLSVGFNLSQAWVTNLLEENLTELLVANNTVCLDVHPYEIVTLRLIRTPV